MPGRAEALLLGCVLLALAAAAATAPPTTAAPPPAAAAPPPTTAASQAAASAQVPPPPRPPPPVSCLTDAAWAAVRSRLTASNYASFFSASHAFPSSAQNYLSYSTSEVANLVYSPNSTMWGAGDSNNRTCVWWWFNSPTFPKPAARPLFVGMRAGVPAFATTRWPSMLFLLSDVKPPAFAFGPPSGTAPSWGDFWSDASTRACAVLTPQMALPNKGSTLSMPCRGADGVAFNSGAKFLVGFAIEPGGSQGVARWGSLSYVTGHEPPT